MQISKIERSLKKISNLVELFKMDGKLSNIEKDLLKDYIRKLYDQIGDEISEDEIIEVKQVTQPVVETISVTPPKQDNQRIETVQKEEIIEAKPVVEKGLEKEPSASIQEEKPIVSQQDFSEFEGLFSFDEITDLSGRLSMTKIDDINKAVGINERMFTIRELFDGDNAAYDLTVKTLNGTSDFNAAKSYLSTSVINKFSWNTDDKVKKAQNFIKIVRRLYA